MEAAVGKLMGVSMPTIEVLSKSGRGLVNPADPFSPMGRMP